MLLRNGSSPPRCRHLLIITATALCIYILTCLDYEAINLGKFNGTEVERANHAAALFKVNNAGYERLKPKASYVTLPLPTNSTPVSVGACCGIGHRLCFNIPSFVYAVSHSRPVNAVWRDVPWEALFNDTIYIKASVNRSTEYYENGYPSTWLENVAEYPMANMVPGTSFGQYLKQFPLLFDMPLAQSIIHSLQDNLSSKVLSFLSGIREQTYVSELHLCAHIREGNNETGDWQVKAWRHIDLQSTLNATLTSMNKLAEERNASKVTVFVASDNDDSRRWFRDHVASSWHVIEPNKTVSKPESGVWFGEHGSTTANNLTQEQKSEAMAEAVSDIFALGECDALYIPNYSSFTLISIMLMRAEKRIVSFMRRETLEYIEFPYPEVRSEEDVHNKQPANATSEKSLVSNVLAVDQSPINTSSELELRDRGYERLKPNASSYLELPLPTNMTPVYLGACCGIGHRLSRNIPSFVYSAVRLRPVYVWWTDVPWDALFNDTFFIKSSTNNSGEYHGNGYPSTWLDNVQYPMANMVPGTSFDRYAKSIPLFDIPLAHSILHLLRNSLSSKVLSFLSGIREQSYVSELHLCAHIREGNNETGDWQVKAWRHIDLQSTLNATLTSMNKLAEERNASKVTVFVASDNDDSRRWFRDHVASSWHVIEPNKTVSKPESGVWFGQHGSTTANNLTQEQKNDAMAEAVSDIFALGECDALYIPNYSSFTLTSIMLMRAEKRIVSFMHRETLEYIEFPYPDENETGTESTNALRRLLDHIGL